MRHADSTSFMTTPAPGGHVNVHGPWGIVVAENNKDVPRVANKLIEKMTEKLGRPPTADEAQRGPRANDDRTSDQKMQFENFKPKRTDNPHPMDALANSLDEPEQPDYSGMSLRQRLAADARRMAERDRDADESNDKKLKRLEPQLKQIDKAIDAENWRAERGSQRAVDILKMLKQQLVDGNDPTETKRLKNEAQEFLNSRAENERSAQQAAIAMHEQAIAKIQDGSAIEVDPIKYRAEQLMAEGRDPTSAYATAKLEASESKD